MEENIPPSQHPDMQGAQLNVPPDDLDLSDRQIKALEYLSRGQLIQSVRHHMHILTPEWQDWMRQPAWHSMYSAAKTMQWYAGARVAKAMLNRNAGLFARTIIDTARSGEDAEVRLRAAMTGLDRVGVAAPKAEINVDNRRITINDLTPEQQERYIRALEMVAKSHQEDK